MGADLYINVLYEPCHNKHLPLFREAVNRRDSARIDSPEHKSAQQEVEEAYEAMYSQGYFRDSYNSSSILGHLGLSWWQDVGPMLDDECNLSPAKARELQEMVEQRLIPEPDQLDLRHCSDADSRAGRERWHKYLIKRKGALIQFLDTAIDLDQPIHCSI